MEEVPDPVVIPHYVLVRPSYSLNSSGTETASIHQEGVLKAIAQKSFTPPKDLECGSLSRTGEYGQRSSRHV